MRRLTIGARIGALAVATSVLVLVGLVAAVPASAAPVNNYGDLQTAFNASGTVELTASITSPASELSLAAGATQVLDIGAFNLSVHSIQLGAGSSLTITGTTGVLTADASDIAGGAYTDARAGIAVPDTGSLVISGGVVHATGGGIAAAGIGAQSHGSLYSPGSISITGGTVVAVGDGAGAGIGGSAVLTAGAGSVNISGGNVTATGGPDAAGIGGGWLSHLDYIEISGGTVIATGTNGGAGIGGGMDGGGAGAIVISGGSITATSTNGAAIGSGAFFGVGGGAPGAGSILITGGTIDADSSAGNGAAIGAGYANQAIGIAISNATITATSEAGAGIGGGGFSSAGNGPIVITNGTIDVHSGSGAGIGAGSLAGANTILIGGGTITVTSDGGGAAIGGGLLGFSNLIFISGGNLTLVTDTLAPVIGSGVGGGAAGVITIGSGAVVSVSTDQANTVVGGTSGSAQIGLDGTLTILDGALIAPSSGGGLTIGSTGVLRGPGGLQGAAPVINNGSITGSVDVTATDVQVNNFLVTYTADPSVGYAGGTQRVYATSFANAELDLADPVASYDVQWFDAPVAGTLFTTLTTLSADITLFPAFTATLAATGVELGAVLPIGVGALLLGVLLLALRRRSDGANTIAG